MSDLKKRTFAQAHAAAGVAIFAASWVGHGAGSMSPNVSQCPRGENALSANVWPAKQLRVPARQTMGHCSSRRSRSVANERAKRTPAELISGRACDAT